MTMLPEVRRPERHALQAVTVEAAPVEVGAFHPGEILTVDLRRLLSVLRRRLRLFLLIAATVMAAAVALTLLTPPQYRATAEVMLSRRAEKVTGADAVLTAAPPDSTAVDTEVEILRSPQLAARVVQTLRLDRDPEFNKAAAASVGAPPLAGAKLEPVVNAVRKKLSISRSGLTYVMDVGFQSRSPAKAALIANEFTRLYLAQQVEDKVNATQRAASWLEARLQKLRDQVKSDETAVQQFKIANNLMSAEGVTLTEQELSNYNQTLAQAKAQVSEDEARLQTARQQLATGSNGSDVGEALNSPTIERLKEQRAEASRKVAVLRTSFQDAYPELQKARNELADIDGQIQAETNLIISNLDAKARMSRERMAAVARSVGGARGELASSNRASVQLGELQRSAEASRALYESYLARYKETSSEVGLAEADAQLVSLAQIPKTPSSPKVMLNMLLGAAMAAAAGLVAVTLAELLETGLATSADVEKRFNVRYLGAIPLLEGSRRRQRPSPIDQVVDSPFSGYSEAFRSLTAAIVHGSDDSPIKTVVVTSTLPGEGKTNTAIGLARTAALQGYHVALLDCDLRRRSLARLITTPIEAGLLEVLAGDVDLDEALVKDARTDADILPLSTAPTSLQDVFGSAAMDRLLLQLRSRYDLVVLDTAPVAPVADSRVLARKADFVAVVARWRSTPFQAIRGALQMLAGNSVEVGGIVLNQVDMQKQMRHGYGDMAYYFAAYKSYYIESGVGGA